MKFKGGILATLALLAVCAGLMMTMPKQIPSKEMFLDHVGKSVVYIHIGSGGGTGFVIKAKTGTPYLITNNHICESQTHLQVNQSDFDQPHSVDIIKTFPEWDLCIAMPPAGVPPLELGDDVKLQDVVAVVGHPKLRPLEVVMGSIMSRVDSEVMMGVDPVCSGGRQEHVNLFIFELDACIKKFNSYTITNHIEPGNSGSPVVNLDGKVIGVVFAGNSISGSMVPIDFLKQVLGLY